MKRIGGYLNKIVLGIPIPPTRAAGLLHAPALSCREQVYYATSTSVAFTILQHWILMSMVEAHDEDAK
jgi:hypothetical protein